MLIDAQTTRLPDGTRVVTAARPALESVAMGIWVGVGSRYEPQRLSGVSHFIEHLLFKGTPTRSPRAISQAIEGKGGYLNAFTQEESTCYYARVAYDHLESTLDVVADMYGHALFDAADIEKERGVIMEEIMMYRDQPQHEVQEMLSGLLWPDHPLGRPIIGSPATLAAMTRDKIVGYRDRRYRTGNTVFAFAGRVDHEACVERVARLAGTVPRGRLPSRRPVTGMPRRAAAHIEARDIEQTHLALGIRLFGRHDRHRYALRLLSTILGGNMSSRLFQVVRERHGLAYSIHSSGHLFEETGALIITAGLDRKQHGKALRLIVRELKRLKDRPVGARELRRAKDYVTGQLRLGLESTTNQMIWIGENLVSYGRFLAPEDGIKAVEAVTPEALHALAQRVLRPSRTSLAMLSKPIEPVEERQLHTMLAEF